MDDDVPGVGGRCTSGVGACRRGGVTECRGAEGIQCGAVPAEPSPELCNGVDDDCNGAVDDNPGDVGQPCTVGVGACERDGRTQCGQGDLFCNGDPGAPSDEVCDEVDNDCDNEVDEGLECRIFRSCAHALQEGAGADGIYRIQADAAVPVRNIWCDQTVDGGGWTLVGSTRNTTLNDERSDWYADLTTLAPAAGHTGIWHGLRPLGDRFDVRFACRAAVGAADAAMDVDLSFYDVPWYEEMSRGTDAESCFSETNGNQADSQVPARRDNVGGRFRMREDPYDAGFLEGEDSCQDTGDFTVDFDNRGMDADQSDGTDWGEDDSSRKCGATGLAGGQWFVFVRERPRVAVVGLNARVTTTLREAGFIADRLAYDAALPARLTTENYDTLVIGRYAGNWAQMSQDLKEALDVFGRNGGNVVTEWDGASIFMSVYDQTYRFRAGAPSPLGWFGGRIGAGTSIALNTPLTQTVPNDPMFAGVPDPIRGGDATQFFFTLADVGGQEFPVTLDGQVMATFPGNGTPNFPRGDLPGIFRGRYCSGHMIFASFDWSDDPANAGLGALIPNLVEVASGPPPAGVPDECKDARRSTVMLCGASRRNIFDFGVTGRLVESCAPHSGVQAMFVTRSGAGQINAAQLRAYLDGGGIVIGEFSISDELYNAAFNTNIAQGARNGSCTDEIMPAVATRTEDGFWQDNLHEPPARTGCGHDLSAFPNIVPLGGWNADTVQIAYRDRGKGRLWMVEADWQDGAVVSAASLGLMGYMATHRAAGAFGRGATFPGVRQNQDIHTYIQRGFEPCMRNEYNTTRPLEGIQEACQGDVLMLACRRVGEQTLRVAAVGARAEVLQDVGNANDAVNPHNSVNWYYSGGRSWGFAPGGQAVNRNSCDVNNRGNNDRICWHTRGDQMTGGWRCGDQTGVGAGWERVVLQRFGDVPVDIIIE